MNFFRKVMENFYLGIGFDAILKAMTDREYIINISYSSHIPTLLVWIDDITVIFHFRKDENIIFCNSISVIE